MTRLPILHGKEVIKALERNGYFIVRQKGSHVQLHHITKDPVTVPNHRIGKGLLRKILRDAQLSVEELRELI